MPLSEDEQRILLQIEQEFYQSDPEFAREVSETTLYRHAWRHIKWGLLGLVVGGVILVVALPLYLLSFVGFLLMFGSAIWIERNARKMGRAGFQQVTGYQPTGGGIRDAMGGLGGRVRGRLRPDDDKK